MSQREAQQPPRRGAVVTLSAPGVRSIREEAAALRAAQATGNRSGTLADLEALFTRHRVRPRVPLCAGLF